MIDIIHMKDKIHPQYYPNSTVHCSCGRTHAIAATMPSMEIDICSLCHPFYTGTQKIVDAAGRIEKFKERLKKTEAMKKTQSVKGKTQQNN